MKNLIGFCSDLHLRRGRGDEAYALKQIVGGAIKEKLKWLIALGDCFDRQSNRPEQVNLFHEVLDLLEEAGVKFGFIQGNHDYDDPPWLAGHRWAKHLHKKDITVGDFCLYGLDYQPFGVLQEELAKIPDFVNVLLCHQGWTTWMGSETNPQGDFAQVPGHITHVATGDLHKSVLEMQRNADGTKMRVCSPGATCMQKIDEPDEHFWAVLGDDGTFMRKRLKSRVFIKASVMVIPEDVTAFIEGIEATLGEATQRAASLDLPERISQPLMRVTFSHKLTDAVHRISKAVGDRAILRFTEMPPEEKTVAGRPAAVAKGAAVTPFSVLPDVIDREKEPELFSLVDRLLKAENKEQEFTRWRTEQLEEATQE